MSRSQTLNPIENFGAPFPPFVKGRSPIIHSNELGRYPGKELTTILFTTFMSTDNTNKSSTKEMENFGHLI